MAAELRVSSLSLGEILGDLKFIANQVRALRVSRKPNSRQLVICRAVV